MLNEILYKKIRQHPHKILSKPAEKVVNFDNHLKNKAQRMLFITHQCEGVGLAANQLGFTESMFVYKCDGKNFVCVNPEIISYGEEKEDGIEGCLSVKDKWLYVPRFTELRVRYQTLDTNVVERNIEALEARIYQHEYDHLMGKLILEYDES